MKTVDKVVIRASENDSLKLSIERVRKLADDTGLIHVIDFGDSLKVEVKPRNRPGGLTATTVRNLTDDDLYLAYLEMGRRIQNGNKALMERVTKMYLAGLKESMPELGALMEALNGALRNDEC